MDRKGGIQMIKYIKKMKEEMRKTKRMKNE
jgi:preprotein translocase subunit SecE